VFEVYFVEVGTVLASLGNDEQIDFGIVIISIDTT
jgi:hypothetical protein